MPSLPQAIRSLGQQPDAVEALAGCHVKRLLAGAGECEVRGLAAGLEASQLLGLGSEHLSARARRDVDPVLSIEHHAVGAALHARRDVAQLGEWPLVLDG